jgi:hypothetical protein
MWRSTRARALTHKGDIESAERLSRDAVAFAAGGDFHLAHADALMDLAEVLEVANQLGAAAEAVREAAHFYELKGNLPQADRAHKRLAELRAPR